MAKKSILLLALFAFFFQGVSLRADEAADYKQAITHGKKLKDNGQFQSAQECFRLAASAAAAMGKPALQAESLALLSDCYGQLNQPRQQQVTLQRAIELAEEAGDPQLSCRCYTSLSTSLLAQSNIAAAVDAGEKAWKLAKTAFADDSVTRGLVGCALARSYLVAGNTKDAESLMLEGLRIFQANLPGAASAYVECLTDLGNLHTASTNLEEAEKNYRDALAAYAKYLPGNVRKVVTLDRLAILLTLTQRHEEARKTAAEAAALRQGK